MKRNIMGTYNITHDIKIEVGFFFTAKENYKFMFSTNRICCTNCYSLLYHKKVFALFALKRKFNIDCLTVCGYKRARTSIITGICCV